MPVRVPRSLPDTHGAVGGVHYLQIVNTRLLAYRVSDNVLVRSENLAAFFGDTDFVFDPRALYDSTWNRFVVLGTRKADSPTDSQRYYWLGVSASHLATGLLPYLQGEHRRLRPRRLV